MQGSFCNLQPTGLHHKTCNTKAKPPSPQTGPQKPQVVDLVKDPCPPAPTSKSKFARFILQFAIHRSSSQNVQHQSKTATPRDSEDIAE
ncbi:hypothetical protein CGZ80_18410 [Rhodopirellula sp. MGV]|nr:hypothetical protein CGZ80_18410 [Rhodopirellula sp. MGV]